MKKYLFLLFVSATCFGLPTYFDYPKPSGSSDFVITEESIDKWNHVFEKIFSNRESEESDNKALCFFTYLYIAERDAAFLSYNTQYCFEGSLDPLIVKITTLFYPNAQLPSDIEQDPYSEELAQIVFSKFKARYAENERDRWLVWYPNTYEVPPPPQKAHREIKKFHKIRRSMKPQEEKWGIEWEKIAMPGTKNWITICNTYMDENRVCVGRQLQVRAVLMLSLSDADAIAMIAKKKYATPRPFQVEPDFVPSIKKPKSSSYPSGHSALAGAGAEVMCHFFPEETKHWVRLAKENAYSRIWAGVHYPMDINEGLLIGKEAAKTVLAEQEGR